MKRILPILFLSAAVSAFAESTITPRYYVGDLLVAIVFLTVAVPLQLVFGNPLSDSALAEPKEHERTTDGPGTAHDTPRPLPRGAEWDWRSRLHPHMSPTKTGKRPRLLLGGIHPATNQEQEET